MPKKSLSRRFRRPKRKYLTFTPSPHEESVGVSELVAVDNSAGSVRENERGGALVSARTLGLESNQSFNMVASVIHPPLSTVHMDHDYLGVKWASTSTLDSLAESSTPRISPKASSALVTSESSSPNSCLLPFCVVETPKEEVNKTWSDAPKISSVHSLHVASQIQNLDFYSEERRGENDRSAGQSSKVAQLVYSHSQDSALLINSSFSSAEGLDMIPKTVLGLQKQHEKNSLHCVKSSSNASVFLNSGKNSIQRLRHVFGNKAKILSPSKLTKQVETLPFKFLLVPSTTKQTGNDPSNPKHSDVKLVKNITPSSALRGDTALAKTSPNFLLAESHGGHISEDLINPEQNIPQKDCAAEEPSIQCQISTRDVLLPPLISAQESQPSSKESERNSVPRVINTCDQSLCTEAKQTSSTMMSSLSSDQCQVLEKGLISLNFNNFTKSFAGVDNLLAKPPLNSLDIKKKKYQILEAMKEKLESMVPQYWTVMMNTWGLHFVSMTTGQNLQVQRSVIVPVDGKIQVFVLGRCLPSGHKLWDVVGRITSYEDNPDCFAHEAISGLRDINKYNICRAILRHKEYWPKVSESSFVEICSTNEPTLRSENCELLVQGILSCAGCKSLNTRLKKVVSRFQKETLPLNDTCPHRFMTEDQLREKLKKQGREIHRLKESIGRLQKKIDIPSKGKDKRCVDSCENNPKDRTRSDNSFNVKKQKSPGTVSLEGAGSDSDFEWPDGDT